MENMDINTKFYLKTPRGFELIKIISVDAETELVKFEFLNEIISEAHYSRICQLQVEPIRITK